MMKFSLKESSEEASEWGAKHADPRYYIASFCGKHLVVVGPEDDISDWQHEMMTALKKDLVERGRMVA